MCLPVKREPDEGSCDIFTVISRHPEYRRHSVTFVEMNKWINGWMDEMAKDVDNSRKRKHIVIKSMEKYASPLALIA